MPIGLGLAHQACRPEGILNDRPGAACTLRGRGMRAPWRLELVAGVEILPLR